MGIDIGWKMIQGAPFSVWEQALGDNEEVVEGYDGDFTWFLYDCLNVVSASPYYDASQEDCMFGVELAGGDYAKDIDLKFLTAKAEEVAKEIKDKYGVETTTICSQNVW